jgi:L-serine kinase (ADP)
MSQTLSATPSMQIELIPVQRLRHIEGFSKRRVEWLVRKILDEALWTKPVALDTDHDLVLDGQHRMEAAKALGLSRVPAVRYRYAEVEVWSLRANHHFDWRTVTERALALQPYPYKTVKHAFPEGGLPACAIELESLR